MSKRRDGLTSTKRENILNPNYPTETLKTNELNQQGEYPTYRLGFEAWDRQPP